MLNECLDLINTKIDVKVEDKTLTEKLIIFPLFNSTNSLKCLTLKCDTFIFIPFIFTLITTAPF